MNPATKRKQDQRARRAALGIKRVEVALSTREREQLETLRRARAGSGEPYSADEYISTLLRRDWEWWQQQQAELAAQACQHCGNPLPGGCGGTFKGEAACWHTTGEKILAL
ncbi:MULTISPECIES: hypothetical protein [Aeromonas]|uniref:hypothetical protein n=1 Tax=Aeromonas TaxID=642 RepID=UPI0022E0CAA3|nr:hypothetical protein [Aeromonas sp. QDB14]